MIQRNISKIFLISLIFLVPLPNIGTDIYTPSLPAIISNLMSTPVLIKWTVIIYFMMYGVGQLIFGPVSDIFGRRRLLILSIVCLIIFSFVAGSSDTFKSLFIARLFQGLSVSIISVVTKAMLTDKFQGKDLEKASAYKVMAQTLSIIFAPLLGAYIQLYFNWRYTFYSLACYSTVCLIFAWFFIAETSEYRNCSNIKSILNNFYLICRHRGFMFMTCSTSMLYSAVALFALHGSFIIQNQLRYNSIIYGISAFFCGLSYIIGSLVSVRFSGYRKNLLAFFLSLFGAIALIIMGESRSVDIQLILVSVLSVMFACGLVLPGVMRYTLSLFREQAGTASAIFGALVMVGMSLFLAISGIFNSTVSCLGISYLVSVAIVAALLIPGNLYKNL